MHAQPKKKRISREFAEAKALVLLVSGRWWAPLLHHSPNEEMNPIARQLAAAQGTRAGFPDYILPIRSGKFYGCAIELKAPKPHGQTPTTQQRLWLGELAAQGWHAICCYGAEDALAELEGYIALGATRE